MRCLKPLAAASALLIAIIAAPVTTMAAEPADWIPSSAHALAGVFETAPVFVHEAPPVGSAAQDPTPQASPPPEPAHTGFRALAKDTLKDFASFPKRRSTW